MKPPAGSRFTRLSTEEMAQRRLDGLCYNCPKKFSREHLKHCTMKGIYLLVGDLEESEDAPSDDDQEVAISLLALAGVPASQTLRLTTTIGEVHIQTLVDSSSTHSFIVTETGSRLGLHPVARPGLTVGIANGDRVPSTGICKAVSLRIGNEHFVLDLYVLPLGGYELVLGCDWLRTLGHVL
ncbi:hypothetical protein U9M48_013926 [Paspalum notatum var. saurae]|uniref:Uncharacterized protein n=1 Tax=Paspalum notatum var. saurae TaxID=547442 RepID=A0AAQ3T0F2_PASNO